MNPEEVMTKEQLAELLHVSERTIERWIEERRIPFIRLPQRGSRSVVRLLKSAVIQWLRRTESKPSKAVLEFQEMGDES
jgi:excisionase family DNA binding protein